MTTQGSSSSEKRDLRIRTYEDGDEKKIVELHPSMHAIDRDRELGVEYWIWKNKLGPYFDPSLIIIAEEKKEVIGFAHAQVRDLKISRSLAVRATQPADLYVKPEHRRRGIASEITKVLRKNLREKGAIVLFGVSSPTTYSEFYSKRKIDPVFEIPRHLYCKTAYQRKLNCASFERKASLINKILSEHAEIRNELMKLNLSLLLRLKGYPPFVLQISEGLVFVREGEPVTRPNAVITASGLYSSLKILTLMKMFFSGNLKTSGVLRNLFSLYKCFNVLRKINRNLH